MLIKLLPRSIRHWLYRRWRDRRARQLVDGDGLSPAGALGQADVDAFNAAKARKLEEYGLL